MGFFFFFFLINKLIIKNRRKKQQQKKVCNKGKGGRKKNKKSTPHPQFKCLPLSYKSLMINRKVEFGKLMNLTIETLRTKEKFTKLNKEAYPLIFEIIDLLDQLSSSFSE